MSDLPINQIICGDCLEVLSALPDGCVHCVVTSPPYWGLRDYGVEGQIGLEKTPEEYVEKMVEVFREVRRVLRDDGTLWLNLGDSYNSIDGNYRGLKQGMKKEDAKITLGGGIRKVQKAHDYKVRPSLVHGLKRKDLVGIPWRVAFALQADGWYLRQDIIWAKPNPMPESVTDRCTKAHEYVFLLTKSPRYFYDAEAIKENALNPWAATDMLSKGYGKNDEMAERNPDLHRTRGRGSYHCDEIKNTRNKRSVWTIPTKSFKESHFATFPPELIRPMIRAGCPKDGVVLDPFGGSGTTGAVAAQEGRNYILIELNPDYVQMAQECRLNEVETGVPTKETKNGQLPLFGETT